MATYCGGDEVRVMQAVSYKGKWGAKIFPFKRFLKCASCGSSVVGEEKFKALKSGERRRHVYYHCSRQVDLYCKEPFLTESELIERLLEMTGHLSAIESGLEPKLQQAIEQFASMVKSTNGSFDSSTAFRDYAKYVLTNGTEFELSRLVRNIHPEFGIKNRSIIKL